MVSKIEVPLIAKVEVRNNNKLRKNKVVGT